MIFCCRFYYFYFCIFYFFIRGFLFSQLGPEQTETKQCRNQRFHQKFAFSYIQYYSGVSNMSKSFLGSLLALHALVFFWSVLGFVAFVGKLRLRADRRASCRCYRLRRLRWPLHIWTPAQLKDGDSCKWVSPLNCAWPDDLAPGSKDLHNLRLLHDARTNNKTIQLQEVQRVSNINYITTV